MREIKFRAWIHEDSNFECENKPCMVTDFAFEDYMPINDALYKMQADRHVLMQYTGLKDKNGREIYEGDILEVANKSYKMKGEIVWSNHTAKWLIAFANAFPFELGTWSTELYEVIGNIYENPELLEAQA